MSKKIHRIWVQGEESLMVKEPEYYNYGLQWKKFFPNYKVKLWSEEDYLPLITKFSKLLLEAYNNAPSYACKSDIARYTILYYEGGLYVDTDTEPLKNYSYLISDPHITLGLVCLDLCKSKLFFCGYRYSNSWLYAKKKCSYLYKFLVDISLTPYERYYSSLEYTWNTTGPGALTRLVKEEKLEKEDDVRIFSHSVIEVTSFANTTDANMSTTAILKKHPHALNVHRMRASWISGVQFYKLLGRIYSFYNNWSDFIIILSLLLNIYFVVVSLRSTK